MPQTALVGQKNKRRTMTMEQEWQTYKVGIDQGDRGRHLPGTVGVRDETGGEELTMNETLYGLGDSEILFDSPGDVLENWVSTHEHLTFDEASASQEWPMKIDVYRRMNHWKSRQHFAELALDRLIEDLDEKYGDHDGDPTEPSESMKRASLDFVDSILKDYTPFLCEPTGAVVEITKQQAEEAWP